MSAKHTRKQLLPLVLLFVIFNGFFLSAASLLAKWGLDAYVLTVANTIFLLISIGGLKLQERALIHTNPNVFIRSVLAGVMLRMGVVIIAVIAYRLLAKDSFSKVTVFAAMILYLIYLFIEVKQLTKIIRSGNA